MLSFWIAGLSFEFQKLIPKNKVKWTEMINETDILASEYIKQ